MDRNPSPLIIALADIADAKEDKPYTEVMDLVEDLLVDFDKGFVKDWSIAAAMHFVQQVAITPNHDLDATDLRKFVIPAMVQTWNIDYSDAIAVNRLVLDLSIHIWGHGITETPKMLRYASDREILLLAQLAVALSSRIAILDRCEHYGDPLRLIGAAMA